MLNKARDLISEDRVEDAIKFMMNKIPKNYENSFLINVSIFNNWSRKELAGLAPPSEERARSVYGLLKILSEIEKQEASGIRKHQLKKMNEYETNIHQAYSLLDDLKSNQSGVESTYQKIFLLSSKDQIHSSGDNVNQITLQLLLSKQIKNQEKIYNLLKINSVFFGIAIIIMPFLTMDENPFNTILAHFDSENESEDMESDIE